MALESFLIQYDNPNTGETVSEVREFTDVHGLTAAQCVDEYAFAASSVWYSVERIA